MATSVRINTPISAKELERRWSATRKAMTAHKIDVLLMQNNNDHMGGYVKYFTDIPAGNGYPMTVVFPKDDRMTVVNQGPFGFDQKLPPEGDEQFRGVKEVLGTPSYASVDYSVDYDSELAARALAPYAGGTIGMVSRGTLPVSMVDYIRKQYPRAHLVNVTDMIDSIKCVKSAEEIALARRTAESLQGAPGPPAEASGRVAPRCGHAPRRPPPACPARSGGPGELRDSSIRGVRPTHGSRTRRQSHRTGVDGASTGSWPV